MSIGIGHPAIQPAAASRGNRAARRASRQLWRLKADDAAAEQAVGQIKARMKEVVRRMVKLYRLTDHAPDSLVHSYDYWSLRRLGLDALSPLARRTNRLDADRQPILDEPSESVVWKWWTKDIQWLQRLELSGGGGYILRGLRLPREVDEYAIRLCNPAFEIEEDIVCGDTLISRLRVENV